MSSGSLIPDRHLTFSPELAATIGLEEAILLQELGAHLRGRPGWVAVSVSDLQQSLPFWSAARIVELCAKLSALGILSQAPHGDGNTLRVAIASSEVPHATSARHAIAESQSTQPVEAWAPTPALVELLALNHGIPATTVHDALVTFTPIGGKEIETQFRQHVMARWRAQQPRNNTFEIGTPPPFGRDWVPSQDALDILAQAGIDIVFAESVRAEFVLYWSERGGAPKEINSRFVEHVRRRWLRHTSQIHHSTEPTRIPRNWQPDSAVYDTLKLAGISEATAQALLPEFVMYWLDSNEVHTSWNSKFLQHVKRQCRVAPEGDQHGGESGRGVAGSGNRSKDRSLSDDLTDTSWAN